MTTPSNQPAISISTALPPSSSSSNVPTSPRLPSPPPPVEDLSNPASLTFMPNLPPSSAHHPPQPLPKSGNRRIRKGTKSRDIAGPPLVPLSELDSAFQLQEHLAALISSTTNPPGLDHVIPLSRKDCERIASCPDGVDEWMWCYELTRRLTRDLNHLVVGLLGDNCTEETCPEMRASLWQYLCAVHDPPRSCCAMDYSVHTLDHAASTLCSTKHFPSRLNINANGTKQLSSIFRRLYRIFAHAWFLHRSVFWDVENEYGLYVFFRSVSDKYSLIPEDNLTIPNEAYDGISREEGTEFIRTELENKNSDSDLEDDIDLDINETGDVPVILNDGTPISNDSVQNDESQPIIESGSVSLSPDNFPVFVFSEDGAPPFHSEQPKKPSAPITDETSFGTGGDGSSPSATEDHHIEMKLDIDRTETKETSENDDSDGDKDVK